MISILRIGSLRSPPPIRLRRTVPHPGDRINHSMLSCRDMAPWLSIHSPTTKWGERWWRQPPKGDCISSPAGRLYGFRRQRRYKKWRRRRRTSPVGTVSQPIGKPFNGQAKGLLWLTWRSYAGPPQYFIPPEGGALNPSGRRQPVPDRTLGAQGQRPGGAINPRPRKTTVGLLNGRPFYGQAKGQLRPTCTSYAGCAHQPSGIQPPADSAQKPMVSLTPKAV